MPCQFSADCLNEIFEYLEEDKATLHSCLLVNRLWCEVTVRILWRNIWNFKCTESISSQILIPLISCLPKESKDLLHSNRIFIPAPKSPSFNYASFCKILSIGKINMIIKVFLKNQQSIASSDLNDNDKSDDIQVLVTQEILNMLMKETCSLKKLTYYTDDDDDIIISNNITFIDILVARDCLAEISEFVCDSNIHFEFFYQLSRICRNIQSLSIHFKRTVSDGLRYLISSQNNLKCLSLTHNKGSAGWADIISSLTKHSNTLTKLEIDRIGYKSLSFISKFTNLQELILSYVYTGFNELPFVTFPRLRVLKFQYGYPDVEKLIKFLETNGENLKEFYVYTCSNSLNLAIAQFCPNLKSLFTIFEDDKIETLKVIFNSCQQLESIEIWCGEWYLKEEEILEVVAKYSPRNFHELKLHNYAASELCSKDLEYFLISWKSRVPQRSVSFIFPNGRYSFANDNENMKIVEKYKKLGIIKKFEIL